MKKKDRQELHTKTKEECKKEINELKDKLVKSKLSRYTKPSKNVREAKAIRHRIAVLLTCMKEQG